MHSSTISDAAQASGTEVTQAEKADPSSGSQFVSKYLEPAIILASLTAGVFLIGQFYVGAYFYGLGIPVTLVDMSPDYYLTKAVGPLLLLALTFFASLPGVLTKQSRFSLLLVNMPLLATSVGTLSVSPKSGTSTFEFILLGSIFLGLYIVLALINKSIWTLMIQGHLINRAFIISMTVIVIVVIPSSMGQLEARSTLEGMNKNKIEIKLKSNIVPAGIEGKELIFLFHKDGKYFVTPAQTIHPVAPEIYIIPDDQIEFAMVKQAQ